MARRKRGSFQIKQAPLSLKQRIRRILIWAGAVLGVLLVLLLVGYFYLISWLQGDSARAYLAGQLQRATAAEQVSIPENLSISGNHLTLPECTLSGAPHGLQRLSIRKLHLELNRLALLRRSLHLHHFSVEEMQMDLQQPAATAQAAPPATTTAQAKLSSGGVFVRGVNVHSFESHYTDTSITLGGRQFSLVGYRLIALPKPEIARNAWAIAIENGRIRTPFTWLRESGIKSATILYRGSDVELSNCTIELAPGHMRAQGVYQPGSGLWNAQLDIRQANVARLLNEDWRKRLLGELWGQLHLTGNATQARWETTGELRLKNATLEGLPFLSDLRLHGTTPYRSIQLEHASCRIVYPYSAPEHGLQNAWLWDNIDVRSKGGEFLVRGRIITGAAGELSGALSVGVPKKMLAELGLSNTPLVNKLFNAPPEIPGYMWVRINLSGTIAEPQEDLSVRLATILPEAIPALADKALGSLSSVISGLVPGAADNKPAKPAPKPEAPAAEEPTPDKKAPADTVRDIISTGLDLFL